MKWLRRAVTSGLSARVRALREALLRTAETVQYDAAREAARQLGVKLRPEPFTIKQQQQSRMDGGLEDDGKLREFVEPAEEVQQPHVEGGINKAQAESRYPCVGAARYHNLNLTGAFQSYFPAYRHRT